MNKTRKMRRKPKPTYENALTSSTQVFRMLWGIPSFSAQSELTDVSRFQKDRGFCKNYPYRRESLRSFSYARKSSPSPAQQYVLRYSEVHAKESGVRIVHETEIETKTSRGTVPNSDLREIGS